MNGEKISFAVTAPAIDRTMVSSSRLTLKCGITFVMAAVVPSSSFIVGPSQNSVRSPLHDGSSSPASWSTTALAGYGDYGGGRSSARYTRAREHSKRQERVGHVVRTELADIIHRGYPIKSDSPLDDDLLKRISIVNADVSPDLRNARITVSVTGKGNADVSVDKRRAFAWLVKHTKSIRYAMAQRLKHMKSVPELSFAQVDVGAAVDVMSLIEKVAQGDYKRQSLGTFGGNSDELPAGYTLEDDDFDDDDDDWIDFEDEEDDDDE